MSNEINEFYPLKETVTEGNSIKPFSLKITKLLVIARYI